MKTLVETLVNFVLKLKYENLPSDVAKESKRMLLDSIGCALAGSSVDKGKIAIQVAKDIGGSAEARIIGTGDKVSAFAAAFANGELINALDYDVITAPPGHVSPFVIPALLALAEKKRCSGKQLICALAAAHEVSARFGSAMAYYRDVKPGERIVFPTVSGYSSTIFGSTLAAGMIAGLGSEKLANALGIGGHIAPTQSSTKWFRTLPASTNKYLMAGWISQAAILSVFLSEYGYKGDVKVLEGDYSFWRYMGSTKWDPQVLVEGLGKAWLLPHVTIYKPYPCGRIVHTALDCLSKLIEENGLQPEEIEHVKAYCDPHCAVLPMFHNKKIKSYIDAQTSVPYSISLVAHRVKPGPQWQDEDTLNNEKIIAFMNKVSVEPHPEFELNLAQDPSSRIGKVEITARGTIFSEERKYRKGSPANKETKISDTDLVNKFRHNAARTLTSEKIAKVPGMILCLEQNDDVSVLAQMW